MTDTRSASFSRRSFVHGAAAVGAALTIPERLRALAWSSHENADVIRIGLVGCGGRGTGAARDAMRGSEHVELVALGDLFPDHLETCRTNLAKETALASKYKVAPEKCFTGFDAYQKVLASGIDLVILATPPGFRPTHLAAAVAAGKHVFTRACAR